MSFLSIFIGWPQPIMEVSAPGSHYGVAFLITSCNFVHLFICSLVYHPVSHGPQIKSSKQGLYLLRTSYIVNVHQLSFIVFLKNFLLLKNYFIVVQLQLSVFSPYQGWNWRALC